jgi:hypothetical protein
LLRVKIRCSPRLTTVIPRVCGVSSTPRLLDSITVVSGILDRPVKPGDDGWGFGARLDTVIASAAKQSIGPRKGRMDCFVAALLAMTVAPISHIPSRSRGADRPRFGSFVRASINQRAQGMPGAQCTRSLACNVKWHTSVVTTVTPEIARHSPRNGFTAYAVLSPATSSCCHRHPRIKVLSARSGRRASANLAPATGARTTRFYRTQKAPIILHAAHRSRGSSRPATAVARLTLSRPPHPAPRS